MPQQTDEEFAEYAPVEGKAGFWRAIAGVTNTDIAATGAKINTHVPTPEEIAQRQYVKRRYWLGPRWVRWLFGTDEFAPK
jgi:hypothetical protein